MVFVSYDQQLNSGFRYCWPSLGRSWRLELVSLDGVEEVTLLHADTKGRSTRRMGR